MNRNTNDEECDGANGATSRKKSLIELLKLIQKTINKRLRTEKSISRSLKIFKCWTYLKITNKQVSGM
jgi:hypothetical protein